MVYGLGFREKRKSFYYLVEPNCKKCFEINPKAIQEDFNCCK